MLLACLVIGIVYLGWWYLFGLISIKKNRTRILAFHDIGDELGLTIGRVKTDKFKKLIEYLAASGYSGKSISGCKSDSDIALTFDDGLENFYDNAFPILRRHNFSATVFLVTDYIGKSSLWDYRRRMHLNWTQIMEMADAGIEFGSHSASHRDLRSLNEKDLDSELSGSKKLLEDKLGQKIKYVAYPFGRFNKKVIDFAVRAGYEQGFALARGEGDYARARACIYCYDNPYSVSLKLKGFWLEYCKDYINNWLAGGTIILRKLFSAPK